MASGLWKVLGQAGPVALFVNLPKPRFLKSQHSQLKGRRDHEIPEIAEARTSHHFDPSLPRSQTFGTRSATGKIPADIMSISFICSLLKQLQTSDMLHIIYSDFIILIFPYDIHACIHLYEYIYNSYIIYMIYIYIYMYINVYIIFQRSTDGDTQVTAGLDLRQEPSEAAVGRQALRSKGEVRYLQVELL